jgi:hypothetical protein
MNSNELKSFFETTFPSLVATKELANRLLDFQIRFVTKNQDHMEFFGGNLTGVHIVRFTPADMDKFFLDVLDIEEEEVKDGLFALPGVNKKHKVASDPFNNVCMYLIHIFLNSKLPENVKRIGALSTALILNYRYITSRLYRGFKYPADPQTAIATYAALNNKFILKRLGTWHAVLEDRTKDLIEPSGLHYKVLFDFTDDKKIKYAITDTQGRVREIFKNIYGEFVKIHERGKKIRSTSSTFEFEGEEMLKDKTNGLLAYIHYANSIVEDKNSIIKQEIIDAVCDIVKTASPMLLEQTLEWISDNAKFTNQKIIKEFIELVLVHSFKYLQDNRNVVSRATDLLSLAVILKGIYTSSRSSDEDLYKLRSLGEKIIKKTGLIKSSSMLASVRTVLMLYIVIRVFAMNHYS